MDIKRCGSVSGMYYELIPGQKRYGFGHSDSEEFYEIPDWENAGGYQGATIHFLDFDTGLVHTPFDKKRNVCYGNPVYFDAFIYFLQGDFNRKEVLLFRYLPEKCRECVCRLNMDDISLYNLCLVAGDQIYVVSQENQLAGYYPVRFDCPMEPNESIVCIEKGRLYISAWVEEGIENGRITDQYRYYEKLIIKDFQGNIISEEIGNLTLFPDGNWWLT